MKLAATASGEFTVKVQEVEVPEHAPLHPVKVLPAFG
jgi:hypothetical protein